MNQKTTIILALIALIAGIGIGLYAPNLQNKSDSNNATSTQPSYQPTQNTQKTTNTNTYNTPTELTEKCTTSYNYDKNFGVHVCLKLPANWQQLALGYENYLVFKENPNADLSPTVTITREDSSKYTSFEDYIAKNDKELLETYHGQILTKDKGTNYYYIDATFQVNNINFHGVAYYYNDTAHGYFWGVTFISTADSYANYANIAPTIVKSLQIK